MFLTSNCCIQLKYEFSIHNIACNKSGEKYPQIKHSLQAKMVQNSSKLGGMDFFTGGSVIIMERLDDGFVSYRHIVFHLIIY